MTQPSELFSPKDEIAIAILDSAPTVWGILTNLSSFLGELLADQHVVDGTVMAGAQIYGGPLYIAPGAIIEPGACIIGPAYIGPGVVLRSGAYVRGDCIFLEKSLLGHASEAKNSLFLPEAKAPHFAYVGDSILGERVNLGAGTKLSNVKISRHPGDTVRIRHSNGYLEDTGRRKVGAILGDDVQIGCNSVINPGAVVGPRSIIYPNTALPARKYEPDTIIKLRQEIETVARTAD